MVTFSCFIFPSECASSYEASLSSIFRQVVAEEMTCFIIKEVCSKTSDFSQDVRVHVLRRDVTKRDFEICLEQVTGDYLCFLEAGDRLEDGAVLHLQRVIETYTPDVVFINYSNELKDSSCRGHLIPGDLAGEVICPEELVDNDVKRLLDGELQPFRFVIRRSLLAAEQKITIADLYDKYSTFGLMVFHAAKHVYIDALPIYVCRKILSNAKAQEEEVHAFLSVRARNLKLMQSYGWEKRFPTLWASLLLPIDFYETRLPTKSRKKFLKQLLPELTEEVIIAAIPYLQQNCQMRWLLRAARCGSPLLYDLRSRWSLHKYLKILHNYLLSFIKKHIKHVIKCVQNIYRRQKDLSTCISMSHLYSCHPSVSMENCNISVRVTSKYAPYIYADEGAMLWGNFIFERGIGFMRFGRRSSVGGNTMIICSQPEGISIGAQVMISWGCTLMDSNAHSLDAAERVNDAWYFDMSRTAGNMGLFKDWTHVKSAPIRIDDEAWIGFNVIILGGVHIGRGAIVGAGSVISKNIPPFTVFAGNPAKFIKLAPKSGGWTWDDYVEAQRFKAPQEVLTAIKQALV